MGKFSRHGPVELVCDHCKKVFMRPYYRLKERRSEGTFCSRQCNMAAKSGKKRDPSISDKMVATRRENKTYGNVVEATCRNCGKVFQTPESRIISGKGVYCSKKCMSEYFSANYRGPNSKNNRWRNGSSFGKYCFKFNRVLKENVANHFGNKCVLCGKLQRDEGLTHVAMKPRRLCIHHVYTDKLACCESRIDEMETIRKRFPKEIAAHGSPEFTPDEIMYIRMMVPLCKSCHAKTINEEMSDPPYEHSVYRKFFTDLIISQYGGRCYD